MSVIPSVISCYLSSKKLLTVGIQIWFLRLSLVVPLFSFVTTCFASSLKTIFVLLFRHPIVVQLRLCCMIYIHPPQVGMLAEKSYCSLPSLVFIGRTCTVLLTSFVVLVLCASRIKLVLRSLKGLCSRLRTRTDVSITFLWILQFSYLHLLVVLMGSLLLWTDLVDQLDLFLFSLIFQLLMWQSCFLSIGCADLAHQARLFVTEMLNFSLHFGNHYVIVCRLVLP